MVMACSVVVVSWAPQIPHGGIPELSTMLVQHAPVPNHSDVAAAAQNWRLRVDPFSRRRFLKAALAAAALPILPGAGRAPASPGRRLVAGTRTIEVNGRPAKVFGLTGPDGGPGIRLAAGGRVRAAAGAGGGRGGRTVPRGPGE